MPTRTVHPNPRELAWRILCRWAEPNSEFADSLIRRAEGGLSNPDRALLQAIVLGTLRHLRYLEHVLAVLRSGRSLQPNLRWLLLSGLCQLFVLRLPDYAVVNETVKQVPTRLRAVVNGVLREALRHREAWEEEQERLSLGVRYSMPDWLVERWLSRFGEQECRELLEWFSKPASVFLRVNELNPPPTIPANWSVLPDLPGWYRLTDGIFPHEQLHAGHVYAADPATRHSVELLAAQPGERILDTCAAPGGKSCAILSATHGNCALLATDNMKSRLAMLHRNLLRAAPDSTPQVELCDWTLGCPAPWQASFDGVLADVPCSNSGVIQRRVDVRWRLSPEEIKKLTATQLLLAENAMRAVKPGGRFVYSTCSIEPEENALLVQSLLTRNPGWQLAEERLILPHRDHCDGAYCALLRAPH